VFDYRGPDAAKAINRLLKDGARVALENAADHADGSNATARSVRVWVLNGQRKSVEPSRRRSGCR